jgi:hypothetical protein
MEATAVHPAAPAPAAAAAVLAAPPPPALPAPAVPPPAPVPAVLAGDEEDERVAVANATLIANHSIERGFPMPVTGYADMPGTKELGRWLILVRGGAYRANPELRSRLEAILLSGGVSPEIVRRGRA